MNLRKRSGPPYTKKHIRRLAASDMKSILQNVTNKFHYNPKPANKDSLSNISSSTSSKICHEDFPNSTLNFHALIDCIDDDVTISTSPKNTNMLVHEEVSDQHKQLITQNMNTHNLVEIQDNEDILVDRQDLSVESDCYLIKFLKDEDDQNGNSSSDEECDDEIENKEEKDVLFVKAFREWCIKYVHTIPHIAINDLTGILRANTTAPFPKDARTLLKTPRSTTVFEMANGQYCHYGLKSAFVSFIVKLLQKQINFHCIELLVNIDGAPLAKSSEKGLWIIACSEVILKDVEVVGIYHGEDKPSDCNELLKMFVEEVTDFINNGIEHDGKLYTVKFHALVCDAPAKAYVLNVKYHTGYYSCTKCIIEGEWVDKMCFPGESAALRTDIGFKEYEYIDEYQRGQTILCDIPNFGLVTNIVLDYMHLICLGVMLKLIEFWINGSTAVKLSDFQRKKVSTSLLNLKNFTPPDFSRNPRQFKNVRRLWKAHELRQFLLYTGPVVLFNILPDDLYLNFLYLHVSVSILANPIFCNHAEYLDFADSLLKNFVKSFEILYGIKNVSHNVHNLLHIVGDVRNFGSLDSFSAFRYENHIRKIKKLVRKGDKPLQQIARRLIEIHAVKQNTIMINETLVFQKSHCDGPILFFNHIRQFQILRGNSLFINCRDCKNNCVMLKEGFFLECLNFVQSEDNTSYVIGKPLETVSDFYLTPVASNFLNIYIVKSSNSRLQSFLCNTIVAKVCRLPFNENFVVFPMIHTYCDEALQ